MDDWIPAAAIGSVAGLRAFTSPAAVSRAASTSLLDFNDRRFAFFGSRVVSNTLIGLALAELVGDKLPFTPSRLEPGGLGARLVSGALSGAAMSSSRKKSIVQGAVAGAIAAAAAAYIGYHLRHALVSRYDLPDVAVALAEDAVAIGGALTVTALLKPTSF